MACCISYGVEAKYLKPQTSDNLSLIQFILSQKYKIALVVQYFMNLRLLNSDQLAYNSLTCSPYLGTLCTAAVGHYTHVGSSRYLWALRCITPTGAAQGTALWRLLAAKRISCSLGMHL